MYEISVDVEPTAALATSSLGELSPAMSDASLPFEPNGLFFDMAGGNANSRPPAGGEAGESGAAAGGRDRKS
jgi:hypothetical protein